MAAYNARPVMEVAPELELDMRRIKRKAVALEMVVRSWNAPNLTISSAGLFTSSLNSQGRDRTGLVLICRSKERAVMLSKPMKIREWTVVVPFGSR
jgi:hypothetical protein